MSVTVEQYNPNWPIHFQQIKAQLEEYLQDIPYTSIEHVGSTSVPGLAAKPIIDIDIFVARPNLQLAIDALTTKGHFDYLGELGIPDRHVFKDPNQSPPCNIYIVIDDVPQARNHIGVRNTLRANPALRDEYAQVKMHLAAKGTNIIDYTIEKSAVIQKILKVSGLLSEQELQEIQKSNVKGERISTLETERLVLREFLTTDIDAYYELEGSEENARYQDWAPRMKEEARKLVLENIRTACEVPRKVWELVVEREGRVVGRVGGKVSEKEGEKIVHFDLWFSFLPAVKGRGYATEATAKLIEYLVGRQDGRKVELEIECDPRNTGSWKLAERLGFEKHSLTERAWESKGEWVDSLVYRKMA